MAFASREVKCRTALIILQAISSILTTRLGTPTTVHFRSTDASAVAEETSPVLTPTVGAGGAPLTKALFQKRLFHFSHPHDS